VNAGEEVPGGLVVACRNGSVLLQLGKEAFNQMPGFVEVTIEIARQTTSSLGRDHSSLSGSRQRGEDPTIRIKGFVGDQQLGFHRRQEMISALEIMSLPSGQEETERVAKGIDQRVDLGAQPTA
jgi:hypothetical protein